MKSKSHSSGHEEEGWLLSYADLVTLLLCVFVLLFSMSTIDADKMHNVTKQLTSYLKEEETEKENIPDVTKEERQLQALRMLSQMLELGHPDDLLVKLIKMGDNPKDIDELKIKSQKLGILPSQEATDTAKRFEIVFQADSLFPQNTADITKEGALKVLKMVPKIKESLENPLKRIEVAGFSDSVVLPPNSPYSSLHMLSAARAEAVSLILQHGGIPGNRISVSGKADSDILLFKGDNLKKTYKNNRRVVIAIVSPQLKSDP